MSTAILDVEYLYNDSGNHDKIYNVSVKEIDDSGSGYPGDHGVSYEVVAEWGARLGVLKIQVKYEGDSLIEARRVFTKLVKEKLNKEYKIVGYNMSAKPSTVTPVTKKSKKAEVKEEAPIRRLDLDL